MLEVLEHPDLPQGDLLDQGIVLALNELLDGDEVARVPRPALVHHPVTALADLAQLLVPEIDLDVLSYEPSKILTSPSILKVPATFWLLYCFLKWNKVFLISLPFFDTDFSLASYRMKLLHVTSPFSVLFVMEMSATPWFSLSLVKVFLPL